MSAEVMAELTTRLRKLGIACDHTAAIDRIDPAIVAVACFPMHMVASASALISTTSENEQRRKDLFNVAGVREAFVVGEQEGSLPLADEDRKVLHSLLAFRRSADIIIYEYALDTLNMYFSQASADVVETLKMVVARTIVAVSGAAGEGWFGSGSAPSDEQRTCIDTICRRLKLRESKTASAVLEEVNALGDA